MCMHLGLGSGGDGGRAAEIRCGLGGLALAAAHRADVCGRPRGLRHARRRSGNEDVGRYRVRQKSHWVLRRRARAQGGRSCLRHIALPAGVWLTLGSALGCARDLAQVFAIDIGPEMAMPMATHGGRKRCGA